MSSFFNGGDEVPGTLEFNDCEISYEPDADSAGSPCIQLGRGAKLIERDVTYRCEDGEPLQGSRVIKESEVRAEVLQRR